jgi:hypothetical protein
MLKIISLSVLLFFFIFPLHAQQAGLGPHGGRLKPAGNYKIELFGCENYLEVYVFDRDTEAVNNSNISGSVEFFYKEQAILSYPLVRYGMDGFTAKIPLTAFFQCRVSLNIDSEFIVTEIFDNECMNTNRN